MKNRTSESTRTESTKPESEPAASGRRSSIERLPDANCARP